MMHMPLGLIKGLAFFPHASNMEKSEVNYKETITVRRVFSYACRDHVELKDIASDQLYLRGKNWNRIFKFFTEK